MSYLGAPPAAPHEAPPGPGQSSDIPLWVVVVAAVVALALAGTLVFVLLRPDHSSPAAAPEAAPSYPAHWDRRIAPYAKIAAHERGLDFLHAVPVRFLSPAKFAKTLTTDDQDLSNDDRVQLRHATAQLRALGLIAGDVNLLDATNDFKSGAVDAYYSFKDQRITVRGHRVTPAVKETLVHELTHVLQDQHFHVGDRVRTLQKQSKHGPESTAGSVLDAIIEGDATRVQHLYAASLGPRQRRALAASEQREIAGANRQTSKVPQVVMAMMTAPYTLGEGLVQTVAESGGNEAVDRLFRHPPTHESALLDPFRVLAGRTGATRVAVPKLQSGDKRFESGELGVLTWYVTLAQRLPLPQALAAADGWGGDAYVGYQHDGTTCLRAALTGRTAADTARLYSALQGWRAAGASSAATVSRDGDLIRFQSCDPGDAADVGNDDAQDAVTLAAVRAGLGIGAVRSGVPQAAAHCLAGQDGADLHRGPADRRELRTGPVPAVPAAPVRPRVPLTVGRRPGPTSRVGLDVADRRGPQDALAQRVSRRPRSLCSWGITP